MFNLACPPLFNVAKMKYNTLKNMLVIQLLKCLGGFQWSLTLLRGANIQFSISSSAKVSVLANICDLEMNLVSFEHKLFFSISFPVSHQNIGLAAGYLDCFLCA